MKKYMDADQKVRIQYESKYAGSANYWKNSMGMNKCIDSIGLIRQKAEYEGKIRNWLATQPKKDASIDVDFNKLEQLYAQNRPLIKVIEIGQKHSTVQQSSLHALQMLEQICL